MKIKNVWNHQPEDHTVAGCKILHQMNRIGGKHPIVGFEPSKVMQDFFHSKAAKLRD
jgi:hypothetical protein